MAETDSPGDLAEAAIRDRQRHDPRSVVHEGRSQPRELVHGELATAWLERIDPDADEIRRLAVRAAHLRRWERPRQAYPDGRAGYLRWRREAAAAHAEELAGILAGAGFGADDVERASRLVRKRDLGAVDRAGAEAQAHEDALCLAFLSLDAAPFAAEHGAERAVEVLARTWRKMGPAGRRLAQEGPFAAEVAALVAQVAQGAGLPADGEGDGSGPRPRASG